jgi:hypothetical protein
MFYLAPVVGAGILVLTGLALAREGWRLRQVQHYRQMYRMAASSREPVDRDEQIKLLAYAASLAPEFAWLQLELSDVYLAGYETGIARLHEASRPATLAQLILAPLGQRPLALALAVDFVGAARARETHRRQEEEKLSQRYLEPALRHALEARDLCPLMSKPHARLAVYASRLRQADSRSAYLARAKMLASTDPELFFQAGLDEFLSGNVDDACQSWRRSLELSSLYLPQILPLASQKLGAADMLEKILPDKPDILIAAANQLYPATGSVSDRRPFLERAVTALENRPPPWKAEDIRLKGSLLATLGRLTEAEAAYQAALLQQPRQAPWRFELARILVQDGQLKEAQRELRIVRAQEPGNAEARNLLDLVERKIAEQVKPDVN